MTEQIRASRLTRRRWYQFGLRSMFVVVTVFGVWLGFEVRFVHQRKAMRQWLLDHDGGAVSGEAAGAFVDPAQLPFWRSWLGDEPADLVVFDDSASDDDLERAQHLFKEAGVGRMSDFVPPQFNSQ